MSRPVYSAQFILASDVSALPSFEVPDGYTAVIRDFTLYSSLGAAGAYLIIQNTVSAPQIVVAVIKLTGVEESGLFQGRIVVPEHGIISLETDTLGSGAEIYVGGYLLLNAS